MYDTSLVDSSLLTAVVLRSFMNRRSELCPARVGADRVMSIPRSRDSMMNISVGPSTVSDWENHHGLLCCELFSGAAPKTLCVMCFDASHTILGIAFHSLSCAVILHAIDTNSLE
jgi:hypothetical protein